MINHAPNSFGTITLIGSGEFGDSMARVYRALLARLDEPNAVFLDTPAGFELNSDDIAAKAADYFQQRFSLPLTLAAFKSKTRATARDVEAALRVLRRANFILAGPGSPSYTVNHWRGTPIWDTIRDRHSQGAHLAFASAAAIATGACALPVYEIFKAGAEPYWLPGLDLYSALGLNLAIVPHWNNAEGGTYDTRYSFMGADRFAALQAALPPATVILGVDEYTALTLDPQTQECLVQGAGAVTLVRGGVESTYPSGESFGFDQLRASTPLPRAVTIPAAPSPSQGASDSSGDDASRYLTQLARALQETQAQAEQAELITQAHSTLHELAAAQIDPAHLEPQADIAPYVQALLETRAQLRAAEQFQLADDVRDRLAALNIVLQDGPDGTQWHIRSP